MADSTTQHDTNTPATVRKGHGTAALGPSDSSDSGSDIQGGPGLNGQEGLFPHMGNTSDDDVDGRTQTSSSDDPMLATVNALARTGTGASIEVEGDALDQRIASGSADLVTANPPAIEDLVKKGKVVAGTVTPLNDITLAWSTLPSAPRRNSGVTACGASP